MARLLALSLTVAALGVVAAQAEPLPVLISMEPYDSVTVGQTTLFRAEVGQAVDGTFHCVTITDRNSGGGSSGVFSGFDLDFVVFDRDGDLATTGDQILPWLNGSTYVTPGVKRKGSQSPYQPTQKHPGLLFGLNRDGSINYPVATLTAPDASYLHGRDVLSVDTSNGWVSLGDGGKITVEFPLLSASKTEKLFLFIGDVGLQDEFTNATFDVELFVAAERVSIIDAPAAKGCKLYPGGSLKLDGTPPKGTPTVVSWRWDLDGKDGYNDGDGRLLGVSFEYFTDTLALPLGSHTIRLLTVADTGFQRKYTYTITLVIPEPGTLLLLLGAAVPMAWRRRRKA